MSQRQPSIIISLKGIPANLLALMYEGMAMGMQFGRHFFAADIELRDTQELATMIVQPTFRSSGIGFFRIVGNALTYAYFACINHLDYSHKKQRFQMEAPKRERMFFSRTFRLCGSQVKQAKSVIINIQKSVFQTAECELIPTRLQRLVVQLLIPMLV